ncbi:hypothetical protein [Paenibacillus sp. sgz5001063]|uniref:hypothetical protein n=1 Tax=Paenibacillus sp. sgz5001063 TaxID=3242474 RepID=UPI0036D423A0
MTFSREHKQLRISNLCPMDLNFLLYIENIYECYLGKEEIFPGRGVIPNDQELLEAESFSVRLHTCWDEIVKEYEQQQYMDNHFKTFHFRDCYKNLFKEGSISQIAEKVWSSFSLWWWSEYGIKAYMERYSDIFLPDLAEQIWKGIYEKNIEVDDSCSLYVILLFKQPVRVLPKSSNNLFFSTINNFVYKREDITSDIVDLFV